MRRSTKTSKVGAAKRRDVHEVQDNRSKLQAILDGLKQDDEVWPDIYVRCWELQLGRPDIYDAEWRRFLGYLQARAWLDAAIMMAEKLYPDARISVARTSGTSAGRALSGVTLPDGLDYFEEGRSPGVALLKALLTCAVDGTPSAVGPVQGSAA